MARMGGFHHGGTETQRKTNSQNLTDYGCTIAGFHYPNFSEQEHEAR